MQFSAYIYIRTAISFSYLSCRCYYSVLFSPAHQFASSSYFNGYLYTNSTLTGSVLPCFKDQKTMATTMVSISLTKNCTVQWGLPHGQLLLPSQVSYFQFVPHKLMVANKLCILLFFRFSAETNSDRNLRYCQTQVFLLANSRGRL